jgi:hypothetical protein
MSDGTTSEGRVEFGTDVTAALRAWGAYAGFPEGYGHAEAVLAVLTSALGDVASCYVLVSKGYVAVRLAGMPTANAAHIAWGYVWVSPGALATGTARGADLPAMLRAAGLELHDEPEPGLTVWNSRGLRDRTRSARPPGSSGRLCPSCFFRWPGATCPDCAVDLLPG